jgi:hypothetical protein
MFDAANQTVNTTINWPGLAVSLAAFIASMAVIIGYLDRRNEKRQVATREDIKTSVEALGIILSERLETKENVNSLRVEVARMGEQLRLYMARQQQEKSGAT